MQGCGFQNRTACTIAKNHTSNYRLKKRLCLSTLVAERVPSGRIKCHDKFTAFTGLWLVTVYVRVSVSPTLTPTPLTYTIFQPFCKFRFQFSIAEYPLNSPIMVTSLSNSSYAFVWCIAACPTVISIFIPKIIKPTNSISCAIKSTKTGKIPPCRIIA